MHKNFLPNQQFLRSVSLERITTNNASKIPKRQIGSRNLQTN